MVQAPAMAEEGDQREDDDTDADSEDVPFEFTQSAFRFGRAD
jgi:hypothetical protein